jgi:Protein of unknown function (DUF3341)
MAFGEWPFIPRRYVVGSFVDPHTMVVAVGKLRARALGRLDTHTPYPLEGVEAALGLGRSPVPLLVLLGGLLGAAAGYFMMYFTNVIDWPINVGNRPPHSPPAFVPVTFELGVLFGAGFAFFGWMLLSDLPRPFHPVFQAKSFARASVDRFVISLELAPKTDAADAATLFRELGAEEVEAVVEWER